MKVTLEAEELQKKMNDLCDLNADLQVGLIMFYLPVIGLLCQNKHLALSLVNAFLHPQVQVHSFDAILADKESIIQEVSPSCVSPKQWFEMKHQS